GIYVWRGGGAPILRALAIAFVMLGLMQPQWVREQRQPANDVALLIVDQSESLNLAGRLDAARRAGDAIAQRLAREQGLDVRTRETRGGPDGTMVTSVIEDALADVAPDRIAGVIVVTDGQAGDPARGDRRLVLDAAPTFGIVGEPMAITGRVIDAGEAPVRVRVSIDGVAATETVAMANRPFTISVRLPKRGRNMVIVDADAGPH